MKRATNIIKKHKFTTIVVTFFIVPTLLLFLPSGLTWLHGNSRCYDSVSDIPHKKVAIVLGTSSKVAGKENLYFKYRMEAAAQLYKAQKVECLIVSGDNRSIYYNEPLQMYQALMELGVPKEKIVLDFAGLRTLDSIIRAKEVFGVTDATIISQPFHNHRALYIAKHIGLDAIGFNAKDVSNRYGVRTKTRETLARVKMWLDLNILDTQPRHLGEKQSLPL